MTIRPATTADISEIFAVRTSVRENHLSLVQLRHMGITEESIGSIISEDECTWIAETEGVTMGFAMADAEDGSVFALFVRPSGRIKALASSCWRSWRFFYLPGTRRSGLKQTAAAVLLASTPTLAGRAPQSWKTVMPVLKKGVNYRLNYYIFLSARSRSFSPMRRKTGFGSASKFFQSAAA